VIIDKEVSGLIRKLIGFFGSDTIDQCLSKYELSLKSSGPVYREYYLKQRHPWWEALTRYIELEKRGKSIWKNLSNDIKLLAADAKKLSILQKTMPVSVRNKFRRDLMDDDNASAYLLEIKIAWHYFLKGHEITWYEDSGKGIPEFSVRTPEFDFDIECKRITADAARKIRRRDFYRLAEKLIQRIEKRGLSGAIDICLIERLNGSDKHLSLLTAQVIDILDKGQTCGVHEIPLGSVDLNLRE
jgi:hypothetical protein